MELTVTPEFQLAIHNPGFTQGMEIALLTPTGIFRANLRTNPFSGQYYVCPGVRTFPEGRNVSLAAVLREIGIEPNTEIPVLVEDCTWRLAAALDGTRPFAEAR